MAAASQEALTLMRRPKKRPSSRRRNTAMALAKSTATVVVFMPPAVDPGEPPMSMSTMVTARARPLSEVRSAVLKPAVPGGDGLEQAHPHPLAQGQGGELVEEEPRRRRHDEHRRGDQDDLALHAVVVQAESVGADVVPGEEADAAHHDEAHDDQVHHRVGPVGGEGGVFRARRAHQVEARVAEGGDGMEHRHPDASEAEIPHEHRRKAGRADALDEEHRPQNEAG